MSMIGILGGGTWGIALARVLCNAGHCVTVWSPIDDEIERYTNERTHPNLPGMVIPSDVRFTKNIADACRGNDILIFAVPSVYVRSTVRCAAEFIGRDQIIADVAKGLEKSTHYTLSEVIRDELCRYDSTLDNRIVVLSGPTHAEDVSKDLPTTIVSSCEDMDAAETVQGLFVNTCIRAYTNPDTKGIELCGALKNIIALASGICFGLEFGDNARAALITRGMAEITRLGVAMGCCEQTFSGLAGIGDMIVTAISNHSRNNRAGYLIGTGLSAEEAKKEVGMVVEGINALPAAMELSRAYNVEMPIICAVNSIVFENASPRDVVDSLMRRAQRTELNV